MLGKRRTIPVIGNLTSSFISGNRVADVSSPREFKIQSPRGSLKSHYDAGGVGLGIVAALEKSAQDHHHTTNRSVNRSNPIPVHSARIRSRGFEEDEMDRLEDYTFVTCHRPGKESFTRVYYDGGYVNQQRGPKASEVDRRSSNSRRPSMFTLSSPARIVDFPAVPDSDFLSACNLCHKKLQGKDIYMYRGEKAFCSTECRDSQILMDEQKENGKAHQRSLDHVSNSAYKKKNGYGQILSPGIFAI